MTKKELLEALEECEKNRDYEVAHSKADDALLEYIDDQDISAAFNQDGLWWYA